MVCLNLMMTALAILALRLIVSLQDLITPTGFATRRKSFCTCLLDECHSHIEFASRRLTVRSTEEWITVRYDTSTSAVSVGMASHIYQRPDIHITGQRTGTLTLRTRHRFVPH